jgi:hypothetical protein
MKRITTLAFIMLALVFLGLANRGQSAAWSPILIDDAEEIQGLTNSAALKTQLINLEKQSWTAWKDRDEKFFEEFLTPDHVEVGTTGVARKKNVLAGVHSPACMVRSYSVGKFDLTLLGPDTVLLTYYAEQDTTCGGVAVPSPVWASSLYVKRGGRWLNAFYQQTKLTNDLRNRRPPLESPERVGGNI